MVAFHGHLFQSENSVEIIEDLKACLHNNKRSRDLQKKRSYLVFTCLPEGEEKLTLRQVVHFERERERMSASRQTKMCHFASPFLCKVQIKTIISIQPGPSTSTSTTLLEYSVP